MTQLRISMIALLIPACAWLGCGILPNGQTNSGIFGTILAGPQCPVQTEGDECADKPLAATVVVKTANGLLEITRFTTDSDGKFRVPLPPGTYLLDPLSGLSRFPVSAPVTVTVEAAAFREVSIQYDTGIR